MRDIILDDDLSFMIRMAFFLGGLFIFSLFGSIFSVHRATHFNKRRFSSNILLTFINSIILKFIMPFSLLGVALFCEQRSWGMLSLLDDKGSLNIILTFVFLDLAVYFQHRYFHHNNWLWRYHRVHHSDPTFDTSTALRFHPIELIISISYQALLIILFGLDPIGVFIFGILLNFSAMFNHSNFSLPRWIERWLRYLVITPDFHRVHHSIESEEMNSNFGFFLSCWDFLFSSSKRLSRKPQKDIMIGLKDLRGEKDQRLRNLLTQPFK